MSILACMLIEVLALNAAYSRHVVCSCSLKQQLCTIKALTQGLIMWRWTGLFPRLLQRSSHNLKQWEKLNPHSSGKEAANGSSTEPGKAGILRARVRRATVIQIGLSHSARGPHLLYGHICCCAGTFKWGHILRSSPCCLFNLQQTAWCVWDPVWPATTLNNTGIQTGERSPITLQALEWII